MSGFIPFQRGMAIPLILWTLAALALTVSAVVHYSRGDTAMTQLRLNQARAEWLGSGLALLAVRDRRLEVASAANTIGSDSEEVDTAANDEEDFGVSDVVFKRQYMIDDVVARVVLYPSAGFVSLNTAPKEELIAVLEKISGLNDSAIEQVVAGVLEYRSQSSAMSFEMLDHPGFRFVEELLSVPGMTRTAYDRLKPWVHTYATSGLDPLRAPPQLANLAAAQGVDDFSDELGERAESRSSNAGGGKGVSEFGPGPVGAHSYGDDPVLVADVRMQFADDEEYRQLIYLQARDASFLRVRAAERVRGGLQR